MLYNIGRMIRHMGRQKMACEIGIPFHGPRKTEMGRMAAAAGPLRMPAEVVLLRTAAVAAPRRMAAAVAPAAR